MRRLTNLNNFIKTKLKKWNTPFNIFIHSIDNEMKESDYKIASSVLTYF
jgi:hypothetical protein